MDKISLDAFIIGIEELMKQNDTAECVRDRAGCYSKSAYMQRLITEAKELIKYGEGKIALENMLENLNEASISIDEDLANLARQAFEGKISVGLENVLELLTK